MLFFKIIWYFNFNRKKDGRYDEYVLGCSSIKIRYFHFDTNNVKYIIEMFNECSYLEKLILSNFKYFKS